jgi:hypothetical protein
MSRHRIAPTFQVSCIVSRLFRGEKAINLLVLPWFFGRERRRRAAVLVGRRPHIEGLPNREDQVRVPLRTLGRASAGFGTTSLNGLVAATAATRFNRLTAMLIGAGFGTARVVVAAGAAPEGVA